MWVGDDEGNWGVGESAPLPQHGTETLEACEAALKSFRQALPAEVCLPDLESGSLLQAIKHSCMVLEPLGPGMSAASPAARHGLEQALLDLLAKQANKPLCKWLLPTAEPWVVVNATISGNSAEDCAKAAVKAIEEGHDTLKIKVGMAGIEADYQRLRIVRQSVGPSVKIRVDANGAWSEDEAHRWIDRMAGFNLEYVEQPVPAGNTDALARLTALGTMPIAADESLGNEREALHLLEAVRLLEGPVAPVFVLKPMVLGGIIPSLEIASLAADHLVPVVVTTSLEGVVGRLGALHVAAVARAGARATGIPSPACGLDTGGLLTRDHLPSFPRPEKNRWHIPDAPGLGLPSSLVPASWP